MIDRIVNDIFGFFSGSDATIIIAHMYVFIFGIVASLYFLV
jgi:hypothetical protein